MVRFVQLQKRRRREIDEGEVPGQKEEVVSELETVGSEHVEVEKEEAPSLAAPSSDRSSLAFEDAPSPVSESPSVVTASSSVTSIMDEPTVPLERAEEVQPAQEVELAQEVQPAQEAVHKVQETAPQPAVMVEREKTLQEGLEKTRGGFIARLGKLFSLKKEIDESILEELEEVLFTADIGPTTAVRLFDAIKERLSRKQLSNADAVWRTLREISLEILDLPVQPLDVTRSKPFVILVAGVNGVGKTTTIGKLASQYKAQGYKVLFAAADTFRAAAIDQLAVWADRAGCEIVKKSEGADPSSVVFDAIRKAKDENYDIVIADTAGRLHTQVGLMEELGKVRRTAGKACEGAPHESFLVLDATTGQNALAQAEMFMKTIDFTGIIITKLDGTAKGGMILGVCDRMKVPVRYVGIGEKIQDLRPFDAKKFVEALFTVES